MRAQNIFSIIILALSILVIFSLTTAGRTLLLEDDFDGNDHALPDNSKWTVDNDDSGDRVSLDNNTLRCSCPHPPMGHHPGVVTNDPFASNNITATVEMQVYSYYWQPFSLYIQTNISGTYTNCASLTYHDNHGWFLATYSGTSSTYHESNLNTLEADVWYILELTIDSDTVDAKVSERDTGKQMWSISGKTTNRLRGDNQVGLKTGGGDCAYDDFALYDRSNVPPVWGALPTLHAVEDVPLTYNFTNNVSDPDNEMSELVLDSVSSYVTDIDGMNVTFLFPNGVTDTTVYLSLSDGYLEVVTGITFVIEPVNDPPEHDLRTEWIATEEVPLTINLEPHIWDIDDELSELTVTTDDIYGSISGLNLTITFPEGILTHELWMNITDGELSISVQLVFSVTPVDDPPVIAPMEPFTAIEDQVTVFNVTPYLSDVDTPLQNLTLFVRSARCTVVGHEIHFHYTRGGFNETIIVEVTDGRSKDEESLRVDVMERNDAPIIHPISPQVFTEDEETTVDLHAFVEDEDTDYENITVTCDHPSVVNTEGLTVTFNFTKWQPEETVYLNISDGSQKVEGQFLAQVAEVNDPPFITGIGDLLEPVEIVVDEGTIQAYPISVEDEDDQNFRYALSTSWSGITVSTDGQLHVEAVKGDVGEFSATLLVEDTGSASDSWVIAIKVLNVNDPPSVLDILKPANHTIVDEGINVTFSVRVEDPDVMFGQVLTVTWLSNISGPFKTLTTHDEMTFIWDQLPVGVHTITVRVSDGEHVKESWTVLEVVEPYVPPPPKEEEPFLRTTSGIGLIIVVVLAVIVVAFLLATRTRTEEEDEGPPPVEEDIVTDVVDGSQNYEMIALRDEVARAADELEASKQPVTAPEPSPVESELPALQLEEVAVPTAEELAEREHAGEVREVMKALTQLPRGLPVSLIDYELSTLAVMITDGPKKETPDGTVLVEIDGKWYTADHTRTSTFLQLHKGPSGSRELSDDERAKKLEKLEERLLDGQISEETYERLRKKYEGE